MSAFFLNEKILPFPRFFFPGLCIHADTDWVIASEHTRSLMHKMDSIINSSDDDSGYERYMSVFSKNVQAFGLIESGAADLDTVMHHYKPVFEFFEDGVLVTDSLTVAGNLAAQRYHSLFKLNGTFDGVSYDGKLMAIRGVTFFEFDENNKIKTRWSNHDHAYRIGQLLGKAGEEQGKKIAIKLNGPGLSAGKVEENMRALVAALNIIHEPKLRKAKVNLFFAPELKVMGLEKSATGLESLLTYVDELWHAFPDLVFSTGDIMSAWSYGAMKLDGRGSHRNAFKNIAASYQPESLTMELITHFNKLGKIDVIYIYQHPFIKQ